MLLKIAEIIIIVILSFFAVYMGLPSLWYRRYSKFTVKNVGNDVAITFDDGPDARYTNKLLDELEHLDTKATFFVLGESAKDNETIIKRELSEGHEVELHGMAHKCHWTMGPLATYKDIKQSVETVSALGGEPKYFRPPWGLYNIFTAAACKKHNLRCVHWSLHAFDWSADTSTDDIINTISTKVKVGDVILLHDGRGADDAPLRTIGAILEIAKDLKDKNINSITLGSKE